MQIGNDVNLEMRQNVIRKIIRNTLLRYLPGKVKEATVRDRDYDLLGILY